MPEFLTLLPPDEARAKLLAHLAGPLTESVSIGTDLALGRIVALDVFAPHELPQFARSAVDGYAVRAQDTHGASDSLPAYLRLTGEVPMGDAPKFDIHAAECALIHTGGMLPDHADAVVMLEHTQRAAETEIEVLRAAAAGENVIHAGEDVRKDQLVIPRGTRLRPAEIGGLLALGITSIDVIRPPLVGLISTGDEVVSPDQMTRPGQVRDVNTYTLGALIEKSGGAAKSYGIFSDRLEVLKEAASRALNECDALIITAGSSASTRDMTAQVIATLGKPGVLVHGINTRPGKPTILGVCDGKAVIGLPGNPVSALVNGYLFVVPVIDLLLGALQRARASVQARLSVNLASQAGREDWWPVKLTKAGDDYAADPIFGKSNLIFTLAAADGLLRIAPDSTGATAGQIMEVLLL